MLSGFLSISMQRGVKSVRIWLVFSIHSIIRVVKEAEVCKKVSYLVGGPYNCLSQLIIAENGNLKVQSLAKYSYLPLSQNWLKNER